jgi:circadian clock protein KaiC
MDQKVVRRKSTGIAGLDEVLCGGFATDRMYLIEGTPGVGKTTLAMQFLLEGVRRGERALYVTLSETRDELEAISESHGWSLDGIDIVELSQVENLFNVRAHNTLFQPPEMELGNLSALLVAEFDRVRPTRMVLDSLSEMRLMAQNPLRYRRQILAFKHHFATGDCTVLLLDDRSSSAQDAHVQSIVHGMLSMQIVPLKFGINRRFLSVVKMRGSVFLEGNHDYVIKPGGLMVFPRLVAARQGAQPSGDVFTSGDAQLDRLVGGGLHAGTGTLFMGPAGSGKSTIASMYAAQAARHGHRVMYFAFDEIVSTLVNRANELGLAFDAAIAAGSLRLRQVDPAEVAPGELANEIIEGVNRHGVRMVVLDSLNGYVNSMPQEDYLHLHLHELLSFLNQRGICTIMVLAQHGLLGHMGAPVDVSYLADAVLLTRFFEARGAMKKAVSVIKKRSGAHENTIRELTMNQNRIEIGEPLVAFEGVMTGVPRYLGGHGAGREDG